MAFNHEYPYVDPQKYNDDWLIMQVKKLINEFNNFVNTNTIKYADPLAWDITRQYEKNTVVVDNRTGNAYISRQPVPVGIQVDNSEYWTEIYNYQRTINTLREQIAVDEGNSTTASQPLTEGQLVFVSEKLYKVISDMIAGDSFVIDSNIEKTTIEDELKAIVDYIDGIAETLQGNIDALSDKVGDLEDLTTEDKTSIVAAINEIVSSITEVNTLIGDLTELDTEDKTSLVAAINEVLQALENNIHILTYVNAAKIGVIADDQSKAADNVSILNEHLASGETIYLPDGVYYINGTITIPDGAGLFGRNPDKCIITQLHASANAINVPVVYDPDTPTKVETCVRLENVRVYAPEGSSGVGVNLYNYTYEVTCHNDGAEYAAYKGDSYGLEYRNSIFRNIQITMFDTGLRCGTGTGVFNLNEFFIDTCGVGVVDLSADAVFNEFNITYCSNAGLSANTTIANKYSNFKVYMNQGNGCTFYNCRVSMISNMNVEENKKIGAQFIGCTGFDIDILAASNGFGNTGIDEYAKAGVAFSDCDNMVGKIVACDKNAAYFGGTASQTYGLTCDDAHVGCFVYTDFSNKYSYNELSDVTKANTIIGGDVGKTTFTAGASCTIDTLYLNFLQYMDNVLYGTVTFTASADLAYDHIVAYATLPLPTTKKSYSNVNYNEFVRGFDTLTGNTYTFKVTNGSIHAHEPIPNGAHIVINFSQLYSYM